jgi:hypothetical protein
MQYRFLYVALTAITFLFIYNLSAQSSWSIIGNSNASVSSKLGTTNAVALKLYTNNSARLTILGSNGYVGIGIATPTSMLAINAPASPLRININNATKLFMNSAGGLSVGSGSSDAPQNGLYVYGRTGMGTDAPVRKLQVQDGDIRLQNGAFKQKYLEFVNTNGTAPDWRIEHSTTGRNLYFSTSTDNFSNYSDRASLDTAFYTGYVYTVFGKARAQAWDTYSDAKLKSNVKDVSDASALISKLKPKTYAFKQGEYAALGLPPQKQYGLIAQELELVLPELVTTSEMPVRISSTGERVMEDIKAVNYTALIPIVVKALQEQQQENKTLKEELSVVQERLAKLEALLRSNGNNPVTLTSAYLEQNTPNPTAGTTTMRYHVPENSTSARLTLTNSKGQVVKTISLNNRGTGQLSLNTTGLAAGTYNYILYVDGRKADTKRLVIAR